MPNHARPDANISVLVLTFNEEKNLGNCLAALRWSDDVVVLDSFSTDGTEAVARQFGARFLTRAFDNYAAQRNFGLGSIPYKHPWVLMVDADEVVTEEFAREAAQAVAACGEDVALFRFRRKDYFLGRWIKRSSGYPTWFGRLARLGRVRVEREINEEYVALGATAELQGHVLHYPFNKGLAAWLDKHNRYSTMEAEIIHNGQAGRGFAWRHLASPDPVRRRASQKALVYSLPGRPLVVFLLFYLVRGGFLDGRAGLVFSLLRAVYEFMIDCKVLELKIARGGAPS